MRASSKSQTARRGSAPLLGAHSPGLSEPRESVVVVSRKGAQTRQRQAGVRKRKAEIGGDHLFSKGSLDHVGMIGTLEHPHHLRSMTGQGGVSDRPSGSSFEPLDNRSEMFQRLLLPAEVGGGLGGDRM
jgi:hypothetical protein